MSTLYELTGQYMQLLDMIQCGDYTEEELKDTLESMDGEIEVKADGWAKVMSELGGTSDMLKKEIDRLTAKRRVVDNSVKTMKQSLENAMRAVGKTKIKTELHSFNIQKNPASVVIDDITLIPEKYLIQQEPTIDKKAIKELLKTEELSYAHLEQSESLRIR